MDVGLQLCLPLGYHGDPALRSAFVHLTAGVLRNGSPFGGVGSETVQSRHPTPYVDALVNDNMAFAVAICEVGPPSQVDEMLKVLFANFEARGTLLGLMKVMIEKEVAQTSE
jgi:neurofibromin 1